MKVGVLKLGARISFSSQGTSGATGEAISIISMLKSAGADVVIFTKVLEKDKNPQNIEFRNIEQHVNNINDIDVLLIINGKVNFFGGAEDKPQLLNYKIINNFKGPVFYAYCDPELTLSQIWSSVSKKPWGAEWKESDIVISRKDIIYISQPFNTAKILNDLKGNEIIPQKVVHFPFEKFPCLHATLPVNDTPTIDLIYGGTMRGGKREKKMAKYYFGHPSEINVEMFGKIELQDFKPQNITGLTAPNFSAPVKYDEMLTKMNTALAHCVIGDPYYEQIDDMSQRAYESITSNVVTFIDQDMDKNRRVFGADSLLSDFLYVSSRNELSDKILALKQNPELRKQILVDQFKAINFNSDIYCSDFVKVLK